MAGTTQADASGSHPRDDGALVRHITRDRIQLYADRVQSPTARHAAALRARAEAVARQRGVVRFGRQPARVAQRPRRVLMASAVATATMLLGGVSALASGGVTHTVVEGDTLSELAEQYSTTVAQLASANQIANPDLIVVGDELEISAASSTTTAPPSGAATVSYTVVAGDTIEDIAWQFDVSVDELVALNGLNNPDMLSIGQVLLVPDTSAAGPADSSGGEDADPADNSSAGATAEPVAGATDTDTDADADAPDAGAAPIAVDTTTDLGSDASTMTDESGGTDDAAADDSGDAVPMSSDDETAPSVDVTTAPEPAPVSASSLHLVLDGETLDSISALYGVSTDDLLAANTQVVDGISAGMILKIPAADLSGIQLVGMPVAVQADSSAGEAAAVEIATGYWAAPLSQDDVLAELPTSDDPHEGYRAVDDYGVYAEPLAAMLERFGFHAGVFYGDADTLRAQLDSGIPVIAWTTQGMQVSEFAPYTDGVNDVYLAPDKQAVVVYGYDDSGVFIVDPSDGQYKHVGWDDFQHAWDAFGDMALAITPV